MSYCPKCGKPVADDAKFCGDCGAATQAKHKPVKAVGTVSKGPVREPARAPTRSKPSAGPAAKTAASPRPASPKARPAEKPASAINTVSQAAKPPPEGQPPPSQQAAPPEIAAPQSTAAGEHGSSRWFIWGGAWAAGWGIGAAAGSVVALTRIGGPLTILGAYGSVETTILVLALCLALGGGLAGALAGILLARVNRIQSPQPISSAIVTGVAWVGVLALLGLVSYELLATMPSSNAALHGFYLHFALAVFSAPAAAILGPVAVILTPRPKNPIRFRLPLLMAGWALAALIGSMLAVILIVMLLGNIEVVKFYDG